MLWVCHLQSCFWPCLLDKPWTYIVAFSPVESLLLLTELSGWSLNQSSYLGLFPAPSCAHIPQVLQGCALVSKDTVL